MNLPAYIARRITLSSNRTFSKLSVRIAIAGIMLSVAVMILSLAVVRGFKSEIRNKIRGFSGDVVVLRNDLNSSYETSPFSLHADTLERIRRLSNVEWIQPYAIKPGIINVNNEIEGVVLKGVDPTYHWDQFSSSLVSGRVIDFKDSVKAAKEIVLSKHIADKLHLKAGDDFLMYFVQQPIRKRKFTIVGIYDLGVEEVDKMYVLGDINLLRRLNRWSPAQVGGYEIRLNDFNMLQRSTYAVSDELPVNIRPVPVTDYYSSIFQWLSLLDVNTQVILVLMMAVGVINMVSALLIIILERTGMIGILKALGSTNRQIQAIFLLNAAYLIGIGLLLGNILGVGLSVIQHKTHFFKLEEASYYMSFVPIELRISDLVVLNCATLLICMLVLLVPSALVAKISPIKTIAFK